MVITTSKLGFSKHYFRNTISLKQLGSRSDLSIGPDGSLNCLQMLSLSTYQQPTNFLQQGKAHRLEFQSYVGLVCPWRYILPWKTVQTLMKCHICFTMFHICGISSGSYLLANYPFISQSTIGKCPINSYGHIGTGLMHIVLKSHA